MGDAPDDPVTVEVARRDLAHRDAITFIEANAAIIKRAPVNHFIMGLVAIDGDVFDNHVGEAGALEKREIRGDLGIALEMETLFQAAIQFKAVPRRGDERSLNDVGALSVRILADEANAVTDLKSFRVGQGHLLIPMIAIGSEFSGHRRFLKKHRVGPAALEADFRLKKNRVT